MPCAGEVGLVGAVSQPLRPAQAHSSVCRAPAWREDPDQDGCRKRGAKTLPSQGRGAWHHPAPYPATQDAADPGSADFVSALSAPQREAPTVGYPCRRGSGVETGPSMFPAQPQCPLHCLAPTWSGLQRPRGLTPTTERTVSGDAGSDLLWAVTGNTHRGTWVP